MVEYVCAIPDREERNKAARIIVQALGTMNPHLRDTGDFKHKLWDHIALMSDFKLDIDFPYEPIRPEQLLKKPNRVAYSGSSIKLKHYGKTIEKIIDYTCEMPESEAKEALIYMTANHMKKLYVVWNRESVNDEQIYNDLVELSEGRLRISNRIRLAEIKDAPPKPKKPSVSRSISSSRQNQNKSNYGKRIRRK